MTLSIVLSAESEHIAPDTFTLVHAYKNNKLRLERADLVVDPQSCFDCD